MNYTCISADSHLDLSWLPPTLFIENASAAAREFMPYVTDGPDGPQWQNQRGVSFGLVCGLGSAGRKYEPGRSIRADRMAAEGIYGDEAKKTRRLTDPVQRVKDQDRDGVQAEVLYGILGAINRINDPKAVAEATRAYNDWLAQFCKPYPARLIGLGTLPGNDVAAAVAEATRLIQNGIRGVEISLSGNAVPLFEKQWDKLWGLLNEARVPAHLHITPGIWPPNKPHWSHTEGRAFTAVLISQAPLTAAGSLMEMFFGGALERFPNLSFVLGESGLSWIPYVLDRVDYEWEEHYQDLELKMKPSEYWKRQCKATFQFDAIGLRMIDILGEDSLMWSSDFPHPDGVWPDSQEFIHRQFSTFSEPLRHKIIYGNAAKLYRLA